MTGLRADGLSTARGQIGDQKSFVGGIRNDDHEDVYDSFHFASLPICDATGRPFRHIDAELQQLEALRERGIITDKEFEQEKKQLDGFEGKLTSSKWARIAKCSQDTATRDIKDLIERGALKKDRGGGRSTSYSVVADLY
ncbi:MAG: hypothetical protein GQ577_13095 [Woeseiaceae bacterium]|nr:hypothetical protein [Woeseiaceae bacterium]